MNEDAMVNDMDRHIQIDMDGRRGTEENLIQNVEQEQIDAEIDMIEDVNGGDRQSEQWTVVGVQKKSKVNKIDVSIAYKDKLPKQFALAKMFKTQGISGINYVKYINPFKVLVSFSDETCAEKLMNCQEFEKFGWRIFMPWEVNVSYGIIKDIDIGLSDTELMKSLSCDGPEILSVKRLNRRDFESSGWQESETIRICFQGKSLPQYVFVHNLRIKVESYIFPVTQCSRCWRYGHTSKFCPSNKVICPKCGKHHTNCETTSYKCSNCHGNHMALIKTCPTYLKERKIRELMSQFSCSYRRALTLYVPSFSQRRIEQTTIAERQQLPQRSSSPILPTSYAAVTTPKINLIQTKQTKKKKKSKKRKKHASILSGSSMNESSDSETHTSMNNEEGGATEPIAASNDSGADTVAGAKTDRAQSRTRRADVRSNNVYDDAHPVNSDTYDTPLNSLNSNNTSFKRLVGKLSRVMFASKNTWKVKIEKAFKMFAQWFISFIVTSFVDLSGLKNMFNFTPAANE